MRRALAILPAVLTVLLLSACRLIVSSSGTPPTPVVVVIPAPTEAPMVATEAPTVEPTPEIATMPAPGVVPPAPTIADADLAPGVVPYDLGETTIVQDWFPEDSRFRNMPVRLDGIIAAPAGDGPAPVVLILHGNHRGCPLNEATKTDRWPCPGEEQLNFRGFDYLVSSLAEAGYVALAINVNGEYTLGFGEGVLDRRTEQLIRLHLTALGEAAGGGPNDFGVPLAGRADLGRLVLLGHSMGGEIANRLTRSEGWAAPDSLAANGFGPVAALVLVAPSVNAADSPGSTTPLHVLLPACDGDVSQLEGQMLYEAVRQNASAADPATTVLIERANHNGFNRLLPADRARSAGCDELLPAADQRAFLAGYTADVLATLWAPAPDSEAAAQRLGLDMAAPEATSLYGLTARTVSWPLARRTLLGPLTEDELPEALAAGRLKIDGLETFVCPKGYFVTFQNPLAETCRRPNYTQPGNPALLVTTWDEPGGALRFNLSDAERDLSQFAALSLRAAVDPISERNAPGQPQSFSLALTDGRGATATVVVPPENAALQFPPGEVTADEFLEEGLFNNIVHMTDIRVPLEAFAGVDLSDIAGIDIVFDQTDAGYLLLADVQLVGVSAPEQAAP